MEKAWRKSFKTHQFLVTFECKIGYMNSIFHHFFLALFFVCLIIFASCNGFNSKLQDSVDKQWVYVELESVLNKDTNAYFYYGQMNRSILEEIYNNPKATGLFSLSDVRYERKSDSLIAVYDDEETRGVLIFRIENIQHIVQYNADPIELFDPSDLHESSLNLRKNKITTNE
jgi:hypothetical protein